MIEAKGLVMKFGSTVAVDRVSFKIGRGEIVGLLGPNGAGKTTTMRILTTHIIPTEGTATIGDYDILENPLEVRRIIGYLPESAPLYMEMETEEYLNFVAEARALKGDLKKQRIEYVIEKCGIKEVYKRPLGELSKGYKQRVGLAQALIHDPDVLILDEPTSGLDPVQIIGIRSLIRELAKEKTIIFSTHILSEASAVSDRLLIIDRGKIVAEGTVEQLEERVRSLACVKLKVKENYEVIKEKISQIPEVSNIKLREDNTILIEAKIKEEELIEKVSEIIRNNNWKIIEFAPYRLTLEETFLSLVEKRIS